MASFCHSKPYYREVPQWAERITSLPVRVSTHEGIASCASREFTLKWKRAGLFTTDGSGRPSLSVNEFGHGVALAFPETLPVRIPALVKLVDFILAMDSIIEDRSRINTQTDKPLSKQTNKPASKQTRKLLCQAGGVMRDLPQSISSGSGSNTSMFSAARIKRIITGVLLGIIIRHPVSGFTLLRACRRYYASLEEFSPALPKELNTFAELFPVRFYDAASPVSIASLSFSLGVKPTTKDIEMLRRLDIVSNTTLILTNDMISWPAERIEPAAAVGVSGRTPCSSIIMIMREDCCNAEEALIKCRGKQMRYERECIRLSTQILCDGTASAAARKLAQAYPLLVAGAAVWHATSPRYQCVGSNPDVELVRRVLALPVAELDSNDDDQAFEQECESIYHGCMAITCRYLGKGV